MELGTLVHVHDTVDGRHAMPQRLIKEGLDAVEDDLKHGQSTAQAFSSQQVTLRSDVGLLQQHPSNTGGGQKDVSESSTPVKLNNCLS